MSDIDHINKVLEQALEDFSISRSHNPEFEQLLKETQGDAEMQSMLRQLAFRRSLNSIQEIGELPTLDWLQSVVKSLYSR